MPSPRLLFVWLTTTFYLLPVVNAVASSRSLAASPSSVSFGNAKVRSKKAQYEILTNSGYAPIKIPQVTATGAGFSVNGLRLPVTLNGGQSVTFTVVFA